LTISAATYDSTAKRLKTEFLSKLRSGKFDKYSENSVFAVDSTMAAEIVKQKK